MTAMLGETSCGEEFFQHLRPFLNRTLLIAKISSVILIPSSHWLNAGGWSVKAAMLDVSRQHDSCNGAVAVMHSFALVIIKSLFMTFACRKGVSQGVKM